MHATVNRNKRSLSLDVRTEQGRDMLQQTKLHNGITAPITGPAVKFSRTPTRVRSCAPEIGEHNAEILESIGLDVAAQQVLSASGVIS